MLDLICKNKKRTSPTALSLHGLAISLCVFNQAERDLRQIGSGETLVRPFTQIRGFRTTGKSSRPILTFSCISRIYGLMNATVKSSSFKSGNSVALRLPKALGVKPGEQFELVRRGAMIEVRPLADIAKEKAELSELIRILRELGPTKNPVGREPIEFPDRPGLY
jgi:antitoxin VapB